MMTTTAVLLHPHYDKDRLDRVIEEMKVLGSPVIRGFYTDGIWYLIEGCHRVRAALALDIPVTLVDITDTVNTVTWQQDGEEVTSAIEDVIDLVVFGRNDLDDCCVEIEINV